MKIKDLITALEGCDEPDAEVVMCGPTGNYAVKGVTRVGRRSFHMSHAGYCGEDNHDCVWKCGELALKIYF